MVVVTLVVMVVVVTRFLNFPKIHLALPHLLALLSPQLLCKEPPAFLPLAPPWLKTLCSVDIEPPRPLRPAKVPRNLHVQWYHDAVEDINKEEVGQLVDPEDFGGGEEWDVVQYRDAKSGNFGR